MKCSELRIEREYKLKVTFRYKPQLKSGLLLKKAYGVLNIKG